MSSSSSLLLLAAAVCLLGPAAVSAQHTFSTDWTQGKRDVSAQQQQLLAAAAAATDGGPRPSPSLLDVLSRAAAQPAAEQQCKPDAEALGLIYDLIMVRTFPFCVPYSKMARSVITGSASPSAAIEALTVAQPAGVKKGISPPL